LEEELDKDVVCHRYYSNFTWNILLKKLLSSWETSKKRQVICTLKYTNGLVLLAKILQGMTERLIGIGRCCGMKINLDKTEVNRISWEQFPVQITLDLRQFENGAYLNCFGSMITNNARCTREIKARIIMAKAAFSTKKIFTKKFDLNLMKKLVKRYIWSIALYGAETEHLGNYIRNTRKI
jgi:hypothetical protein